MPGDDCLTCVQVLAWLARDVPVDLVVDGSALDATSLGRHLRRHGHRAAADRVNPGGRLPEPVVTQQTLPGVA